jgi:ABC-2 type transport system ATP-binding protein
VRTPRAAQLAGLLTSQGATVEVIAPDWVEVTGAAGEKIGTLAAEQAIPIFETTTESADLEDIFLRLTTSSERTEVA